MTAPRNPSLLVIILRDLGRFKWLLILAVICLVSALAVIVITQNTRMLIVKRSELIEQRDSLNNDWRHLLLEANALDEHNRIEQLAQKRLQMIRPQPNDEVLVTP